MKKTILLITALLFGVLAAKQLSAQNTSQFVHFADVNNIISNRTKIDHPDLNGQHKSLPQFTHNFNPNSGPGKYVKENLGMWYSGGHWYIYNEDLSPFTDKSNYNILIPGNDMISWVHQAADSNSYKNRTFLYHPDINGDSTAQVFFTCVYEGVYTTQNLGIYYSKSRKQWAIYNQKGTSETLDSGLTFHVAVVKKKQSNLTAFVHTATQANTTNNSTVLDHPYLNGNAAAMIHITQVWNPNGAPSGVYNDQQVGVYYNGTKWSIFNENQTNPMPDGASFNVVFVDPTIGTNEFKAPQQLMTIFPNPITSAEKLTLHFNQSLKEELHISVYNLNGASLINQVIRLDGNGTSHELDIARLTPGIYLIQVESEGQVGTQKLIVQ